jgi:CubicO group peptidase (beta-lactamase class C family)
VPTPSGPASALFDELRAFVSTEMARLGVPGAAIGLRHGGNEEAAGLGVTGVDHPQPVDADTLFPIGPITMTYTATAAMRLADQGRLDIDRSVREYLPGFRLADDAAAAAVTPRHLLSHTGGFVGDYFLDTGRGDEALARYVGAMARLEQLTPPGEVFSFSWAGFSLLGRVVEVVAGQTFEAALKRLVLEPLGLERSFLVPAEAATHRFAVGHRLENGRARALPPWLLPRSAWPAGGLVTSVRDQLRYAGLQRAGTAPDGTALLSPTTLVSMRLPQLTASPAIGLGWYTNGGNVWHGGGAHGHRSYLTVDLGGGVVLSVLANAEPGGGELIASTQRWVFDRLFNWRARPPPILPLHRDLLDAYAGLYAGALADYELTRDGDALVVRHIPKGGFPTADSPPPPAVPPFRMGFYGTESLVGLDPPFDQTYAEVLRRGGEVAWLRLGGRIHRRVR